METKPRKDPRENHRKSNHNYVKEFILDIDSIHHRAYINKYF